MSFLSRFLKLTTVSQVSSAIDNSSFKIYKDGLEIDKTGFVFTGFNTSANPENAVFSVSFNRDVEFDSFEFINLVQLGEISEVVTFISMDNVNYTEIDIKTGVTKGNETTITPISQPTTPTIDTLINDALASIKTYADSKDASVKAYADALIAQLMQTTDLEAKIALLNQVNDILDGDSATAGFQLWESNVAKLNQVVADLTAESAARSSAIASSQNAFQTSINSKSTEINARIDLVVSGLNSEITAKTTAVSGDMSANFVAMKAKAAIIFAV